MVQAAEANVGTGPPSIHLKENVTAAPDPAHAKSEGWVASVAVGAGRVPKIGEIFYGRFLEFGTVKQAARPWLRPAFDTTRVAVTRRLAALLAKRVRAAGRK
jgi:HK97 gp10 family phage protein